MSRGRGQGQENSVALRTRQRSLFGTIADRQQMLAEYAELGTIIPSLETIEDALRALRAHKQELKVAERDIILDLDDTLSVNNTLYVASKQKLSEYLARKFDADASEYLARFNEIDEGLIPSWGFTPERWHESSRRLAEEAHGRKLLPGEFSHVRKLSGIALGVGIPFPDTIEALTTAKRAGMKIVLKTKGSERLQQEKIMAHNFAPFFHGIEIVQAKTPDSMAALADEYELRNPVMIGDSMNSDIKPALGAGLGAVLMRYHHNTWDYESPKEGAPKVLQAACLSQALLYIAQRRV